MFRSKLSAMKSLPGLSVITGPDEVCQEDLRAARLLLGYISRETALIYSLVSVSTLQSNSRGLAGEWTR